MYNIIVCDDERDIVSALEIYLTAEGYHVLRAENGREALALANSEDAHLMLLDVMMPNGRPGDPLPATGVLQYPSHPAHCQK